MTFLRKPSLELKAWAYNSSGNLRAIWRVGVFVSVYFLANGIISAVGEPVLSFLSTHAGGVIGSAEWLNACAALAAVAVTLRQVDGQPWSSVGLGADDATARNVMVGAALGTTAMVATTVLVVAVGDLRWASDTTAAFLSGDIARSPGGAWFASTARITLLLAPAAFFEEILFRGYLWRVADDSGNPLFALVASSLLFGLVHVQNPGASVLPIVNVMLAGLALGMIRLETGSLWAAWAAHFMWNWIMAAGLHVAVSGLPMATPGYRAVMQGPQWLSGGDWGPEGGAFATVVLVAAIAWGTQQPTFTRNFSTLRNRGQSAITARSA